MKNSYNIIEFMKNAYNSTNKLARIINVVKATFFLFKSKKPLLLSNGN